MWSVFRASRPSTNPSSHSRETDASEDTMACSIGRNVMPQKKTDGCRRKVEYTVGRSMWGGGPDVSPAWKNLECCAEGLNSPHPPACSGTRTRPRRMNEEAIWRREGRVSQDLGEVRGGRRRREFQEQAARRRIARRWNGGRGLSGTGAGVPWRA